jgi:hypothetical protein
MNRKFEAFIMPGSDTDIGLFIPLLPSWMKDPDKMKTIMNCNQIGQTRNMVVNEIRRNETHQKKLIVLKFPTPINNRYFNGKNPNHEKDSPPEDAATLNCRLKSNQHEIVFGGTKITKNKEPVKTLEGYLY